MAVQSHSELGSSGCVCVLNDNHLSLCKLSNGVKQNYSFSDVFLFALSRKSVKSRRWKKN